MCSEPALTLAVVSSQQHGSPWGIISSGRAEKKPRCARELCDQAKPAPSQAALGAAFQDEGDG